MQRIVRFSKDIISFIIFIIISIFFIKRNGTIVLVYHSVGQIDAEKDLYRLNLYPENFEKHLKVISEYRGKIEITFDDGYGNNFENAFPLLKKYNFSATIFLVTDFIDGKIKSESFGGEDVNIRPLTWDEIKIMDKSEIKFGSHSKTHALLTKISEGEVRDELVDSKKRIEDILGHKIENFAYPFGNIHSFNKFIKLAVAEAKYACAYTNIMGINKIRPRDKFVLRRMRIYSEDTPFKLKMKLKGAYDWVDTITSLRLVRNR